MIMSPIHDYGFSKQEFDGDELVDVEEEPDDDMMTDFDDTIDEE